MDVNVLLWSNRNKPLKTNEQDQLQVDIIPLFGGNVNYEYATGYVKNVTNSIEMNVNGSVTPQTFSVSANQQYNLCIKLISIIIQDNTVSLDEFGNLGTLLNGWDLKITNGRESFIVNKAKTFAEIIEQVPYHQPFGDNNTVFQLANASGALDTQIIQIKIDEYIPNGLIILKDSKTKLVSTINDDLTGLNKFRVKYFGYKSYA